MAHGLDSTTVVGAGMPPPLDLVVEDVHNASDIQLLDDIDSLRSHGISHLVALPQLIVCGDQSSGKSSVLEAVSGIPFPTKDNLCTRFATEVILRRAQQQRAHITISPGRDRDAEASAKLSTFQHTISDWNTFGDVIDLARISMGLDDNSRAFTDDVLRVEITGPSQPHLTIVDLPGLIHSHGRSQTAEDVEIVQRLIRGYMSSGRSIILAIVSAKNDHANQIVLKMAREIDAQGVRTLGIITKPDTLAIGSEGEAAYLSLARNEDIIFSLGWHVLKNRDYASRTASSAERNENELNFLSQGVWGSLPRSNIAVGALRRRLSQVLLAQIKRELPSLLREIEVKLEECITELRKIGPSRATETEQRRFLLQLSQGYAVLARAAIDGVYGDEFFGDPLTNLGRQKRFRAVVQNLSLDFSEMMRLRGHRYDVVDKSQDIGSDEELGDQIRLTRHAYLEHAKTLLKASRGRELPGTFNPLLIADLFHEQHAPWAGLLSQHLESIFAGACSFVQVVIKYLAQAEVAEAILDSIINHRLKSCMNDMTTKSRSLLKSYERGHPITYNHYFTETIQNVRAKRNEKELADRLRRFMGKQDACDIEDLDFGKLKKSSLIAALSIRNQVDMDLYSCAEAADCMFAYYKVAMKVVVDNVATQCIEDVLMRVIPDLFSNSVVLEMDANIVRRIAGESADDLLLRDQLQERARILERGQEICRRHRTSRIDVYMQTKQGSGPTTISVAGCENEVSSDHDEVGTEILDPESNHHDAKSTWPDVPEAQATRTLSPDDFIFTSAKSKVKLRKNKTNLEKGWP